MTLLTPTRTSYSQFTWCPDGRNFVAEMSEINGFGRVYDDSCDEGLTIVGKTGREVVFVVEHVEVDRAENEILFWELSAVKPADRELGVGVTIYND
jgi:hypothetical protein